MNPIASVSSPPAAGTFAADDVRVRRQLLECGLRAAIEQGTGPGLLSHVTGLSGLPASTVRMHFADGDDLLRAIAQSLSDEIVFLIERSAGHFVDPAKRIACGVRMYLKAASDHPTLARLVAKAGTEAIGPQSLAGEYLPAHIAHGLRTGRFVEEATSGSVELVCGTTLAAVARIAAGPVRDGFDEQVAALVLRGLGVPAAQARRLAIIVPPRIEPRAGSLLSLSRAVH